MKKILTILTLLLVLSLAACGQKSTGAEASQPTDIEDAAETAQSAVTEAESHPSETAEAAEPDTSEADVAGDEVPAGVWRPITEEKARELIPLCFRLPEGAEQAHWIAQEPEDDYFGLRGTLVQLTFVLDGLSYTARAQVTQDMSVDVSEVDCDWTSRLDGALTNWGEEPLICHCFRYLDDSGYVDLCTWYDLNSGTSYSLTVSAADLDGFDLQAIVETMSPVA